MAAPHHEGAWGRPLERVRRRAHDDARSDDLEPLARAHARHRARDAVLDDHRRRRGGSGPAPAEGIRPGSGAVVVDRPDDDHRRVRLPHLPRARHDLRVGALIRTVRRPVLLAVAALALLALPAGLVAADESWVVDRFVADITIHPDASLHIVETIDVDFGSSQRHGIFRDIPVRYHYDDTHVRVYRLTVGSVTDASDRAIPYEVTDQGGYREIKVGDANVLVSGRRSYRISYDVVGAMNAFADRDELFWNVNGGSWPVATTLAMATVHAPVGIDRLACYQGLAGATNTCPTALSASKDSATFGPSHRLASGEQLTLVAGLAKGAIAEPMPILERDTDNALTFIEPQPAYLALAVALLVGALAILFWRWYTAGRDLRDR
ncbi:MAG: DUF2207 domain-containing protein, partial [Chloroflexi bacterium]